MSTVTERHERAPNRSECAACGQWFTSDSAFDAHLGSIPKVGRPRCKDPTKVKHGKDQLVFDTDKQAWRWPDSGKRMWPSKAA